MTKGFYIYNETINAFGMLDDATAGKILKAMCSYHLTGAYDDSNFSDMEKAFLSVIQGIMDSQKENTRKRSERAKNGIKNKAEREARQETDEMEARELVPFIPPEPSKSETKAPEVPKEAKKKASGRITKEMQADIDEVVSHFNTVAKTNYTSDDKSMKTNLRRIMREGHTADECKLVIDYKKKQWGNSKMMANFQPKTIFSITHFGDYLEEARANTRQSTKTQEVRKENIIEDY